MLTDAELTTPSNRQAPIAATLRLQTSDGAEIGAVFDFLQTGPQQWDITVETNDGALHLTDGGARLNINGAQAHLPPAHADGEYQGVYDLFTELVRARRIDVDLRPLALAADACLRGHRNTTLPFYF